MRSRIAAPWPLLAWCGGVYAFLYLPIAVMAAFSFNAARRNVVWKGFTLRWYGELFHNQGMIGALITSVGLGIVATGVALTLAILASYALARHPPFRGRATYTTFLNVPMMMPEVVLGVGLLMFFVRTSIPLSFGTLLVSHVVFCLPFAVGAVRARLMSLWNEPLEEAAMDLGATEWEAFRKITLPLLRPALISGGLLTFTVSFQDFVTSFFVVGVGTETLPIRIYSMMKFGVTPEVNALATVVLILTLGLLGAHYHLSGERPPIR